MQVPKLRLTGRQFDQKLSVGNQNCKTGRQQATNLLSPQHLKFLGKRAFSNENIKLSTYYTANPVLGKPLCSDWFFFGQDFAVRTVSMETVQPLYFCFGAKPANSKLATKTAKKKL